MSLTSGAATAGFGFSTFATGFPFDSTNVGPLGIVFVNNGVLVSDAPGNVRFFPSDTDGQNAANIPVGYNYGHNNALGMAQVNGNIYMTQSGSSLDVRQINADGTPTPVVVGGFGHPVGIVADPFNGHLFVSDQFTQVYDVDPIAGTKTSFVSVPMDGLTLSADGKTLYGAAGNGHILGYSVSTMTKVFDSGLVQGGVDGTALGTGKLAGNIFTNTNDGHLLEFNLADPTNETIIGSGGSRGDFVTVDPNGTLLLTQTDRILRLNFQGSGFGVPEPGAIALLTGAAFFGGSLLLRRHRK